MVNIMCEILLAIMTPVVQVRDVPDPERAQGKKVSIGLTIKSSLTGRHADPHFNILQVWMLFIYQLGPVDRSLCGRRDFDWRRRKLKVWQKRHFLVLDINGPDVVLLLAAVAVVAVSVAATGVDQVKVDALLLSPDRQNKIALWNYFPKAKKLF